MWRGVATYAGAMFRQYQSVEKRHTCSEGFLKAQVKFGHKLRLRPDHTPIPLILLGQ